MSEIAYIDGVAWKASVMMQEAGNDVMARDKALTTVSATIACITNTFVRSEYIKMLYKPLGVSRKELENKVRSQEESYVPGDDNERLYPLPDGVDPAFVAEWGFYELRNGKGKTGYFFDAGRDKKHVEVSNFTVRPLFHLYSAQREMNKRMIEIDNGYVNKTIEMQSTKMISVDGFSGELMQEGHYIFHGARPHLIRLNDYWGDKFPTCFELTNLGWQKEGFFAYSDRVYNGELLPYNEYGVIVHNQRHYYSPGANKKRTSRREEAGKFDADHQLQYCDPLVSWEEWCHMVAGVYPDHYVTAIGAVVMSCLRDLVLQFSNNFPLLYCYGERQSGKSEFGLSIMSVFIKDAKMFNLNSGTDAAFFTFVGRYANCFVGLNEYDDKDIRPEWHQAIKGFYDNEGRKRNRDKHTMEEQPINCMAGLFGQYLSTRDDNAVPSRSLLCQFMAKPNRTQDEIDRFQRLLDVQKRGLNGMLCEILQARMETLQGNALKDLFDSCLKELREVCKLRELRWEDRVGRNYALLITVCTWAAKMWKMPFSIDVVKAYAMRQMMDVVNIMHTTDVLMQWWIILSNLADNGTLIQGWHYKIKHAAGLPARKNGVDIILGEDAPKRVLMIRLNYCHAEYQKEMKRTQGNTTMQVSSLEGYFKNRDYFLGTRDGEWFDYKDERTGKKRTSSNTSVFVFDYDLLEKLSVYMDYDKEDTQRQQHMHDHNASAVAGYNPNLFTEGRGSNDDIPF